MKEKFNHFEVQKSHISVIDNVLGFFRLNFGRCQQKSAVFLCRCFGQCSVIGLEHIHMIQRPQQRGAVAV